jgi:hypothetical protein
LTENDFFELIESHLTPTRWQRGVGEEFASPALDVLAYFDRPVRLHWVPILGQASSVVAVIRQPVDLNSQVGGSLALLDRVAQAVHGRYPPWPKGRGVVVGLTTIVLTPEPLRASQEEVLVETLKRGRKKRRVVPLGLIRLNLGQEAMVSALTTVEAGLFPEPIELVDLLAERFQRFVPLLEF